MDKTSTQTHKNNQSKRSNVSHSQTILTFLKSFNLEGNTATTLIMNFNSLNVFVFYSDFVKFS